MNAETKLQISQSLREFRLPRFNEIPNVGLYLEQAVKYVHEYLSPLGDFALTPSMISNYVKKGLIDKPTKKLYGREQIAYLFFIAVAKSILSLDALTGFIQVQQSTYPLPQAYDYFCSQLEGLLAFTFELSDNVEICGEDSSHEKRLLFTCIMAAVQKIYLEKCLEAISNGE